MKIYDYNGTLFDDSGIRDKITEDFDGMLDENITLRGFLRVMPEDLYNQIKDRYLNDQSLYNQMGIEVKEVHHGACPKEDEE